MNQSHLQKMLLAAAMSFAPNQVFAQDTGVPTMETAREYHDAAINGSNAPSSLIDAIDDSAYLFTYHCIGGRNDQFRNDLKFRDRQILEENNLRREEGLKPFGTVSFHCENNSSSFSYKPFKESSKDDLLRQVQKEERQRIGQQNPRFILEKLEDLAHLYESACQGGTASYTESSAPKKPVFWKEQIVNTLDTCNTTNLVVECDQNIATISFPEDLECGLYESSAVPQDDLIHPLQEEFQASANLISEYNLCQTANDSGFIATITQINQRMQEYNCPSSAADLFTCIDGKLQANYNSLGSCAITPGGEPGHDYTN